MITRDLHEGAEACLCSLCEKALQIICIYTFPAYCFKQTNLPENCINSTFWFHFSPMFSSIPWFVCAPLLSE